MLVAASVRLATHLNAVRHGLIGVDVAARTVVADQVAHHVVDTDGLLGLDPFGANELASAVSAATMLINSDWMICLPRPGAPAGLSGPGLAAAIDTGVGVIPVSGGVVMLPVAVGKAIQWSVHAAGRAGPVPDSYEAERVLSETILLAGHQLAELTVAESLLPDRHGRDRRGAGSPVALAPGYPARKRIAADRSLRLLTACDSAMADDTGVVSSFELQTRSRLLRRLRDAAADALAAAVVWPEG